MARRIPKVGAFDSVSLSGPGRMHISQGRRHSITIEAPTDLHAFIDVSVVAGNLLVVLQPPTVVPFARWRDLVKYEVTLPELRGISVRGSGRVEIPDIDSDELTLELVGGGEIAMAHLTADSLRCAINGSGRVQLVGDIETQEIEVRGSGVFEGSELISDFARVTVHGSGQLSVLVNHELAASVVGSGKIRYQGQPELIQQVIGSGSIQRLSGRRSGVVNREVPNL